MTWFHAIPFMEPFYSLRFDAWKRHEIIASNHMVPLMELRGLTCRVGSGWVCIHQDTTFQKKYEV